MGRIRYLKPDFFRDEDVCELSFSARLLFAGIWTIADNQGKLEDKPRRIGVDIFPFDKVDIDALLGELVKKPLIHRYEVDGKRYIKVIGWDKHQRPHHTEKGSTIPEPDTVTVIDTVLVTDTNKKIENRKAQTESTVVKQPLSNVSLTVISTLDFERIWKLYPKRDGRKAAERHFCASVKTDKDYLDIQTALSNYLLCDAVRNGYIKSGSTWFNNWQDWISPTQAMTVNMISLSTGTKVPELGQTDRDRLRILSENGELP